MGGGGGGGGGRGSFLLTMPFSPIIDLTKREDFRTIEELLGSACP